jgi:hypothetical protein
VSEGTVGGAGEQWGVGKELAVAPVGSGNSRSDPVTLRILAGLVATVHDIDSLFTDATSMMQQNQPELEEEEEEELDRPRSAAALDAWQLEAAAHSVVMKRGACGGQAR